MASEARYHMTRAKVVNLQSLQSIPDSSLLQFQYKTLKITSSHQIGNSDNFSEVAQ